MFEWDEYVKSVVVVLVFVVLYFCILEVYGNVFSFYVEVVDYCDGGIVGRGLGLRGGLGGKMRGERGM